MDLKGKWEKRWHPLRAEWVVYAAHRNARPWNGAPPLLPVESKNYEPECYLCPRNKRSGGHLNPDYKQVYIFDNDHPVVGINAPDVINSPDFYKTEKATGISRVICFDPQHNLSLSAMSIGQVTAVFDAFKSQTTEMLHRSDIHSVLIFENRGEAVGVSNPHPHGQLYATDFPLKHVTQQLELSEVNFNKTGKDIFQEIINAEIHDGRRIIYEDQEVIAFIPFFARYAYELMIFPKQAVSDLTRCESQLIQSLAKAFRTITGKLDALYQMNVPYVMSVMQAPVDGNHYKNFRLHIWLQPPFRQPGLIKYLAGPELGAGNFMADTIPEEKALELRNISINL